MPNGSPEPIVPTPPLWPGFWSRAEHTVRLSVWNAVPGVTLTLVGVVGGNDGITRPFLYTFVVPNSTRTLASAIFPLEDGVLMAVQVYGAGGALTRGNCYVKLELLHGREGGTISLGTILADYVTVNVPAAYPGQGVRHPLDGRGAIRSITNPAPAVATDFSIAVPTNARWQVRALHFTFTTSATVGNRLVEIAFDDGTNVFYNVQGHQSQPASTTTEYDFGLTGPDHTYIQIGRDMINLADLFLLAGYHVTSSIGGTMQAGDQLSAQQVLVEEWIDV